MELDELISETREDKTIHVNGTSDSNLNENTKEKPFETDKSETISYENKMDLLIEDVNEPIRHPNDDNDSRHQIDDDNASSSSSSLSYYQSFDESKSDLSEEMTLRLTSDEEDDELVKNENANEDNKEIELNESFEHHKVVDNLENTDNVDKSIVKETNISLERNIEDDDKSDKKESKKRKTLEEYVSWKMFYDFMEQNDLTKLSRADLESFCVQKLCELINEKSIAAELFRIKEKLEQLLKLMIQKYASLENLLRDVNIVNSMVKAKKQKIANITTKAVEQVKIKRSVGIQVNQMTTSASIRPRKMRSTLMCKPVPTDQVSLTAQNQQREFGHPAPLPAQPAMQLSQPYWKTIPPMPTLEITRISDGIIQVSWKILNQDIISVYEDIASYQLYAYQETRNASPSTEMWMKVGDVKALELPMACVLTEFTDGNRYHFAVRAVDVKSRVGPFSFPKQITPLLQRNR